MKSQKSTPHFVQKTCFPVGEVAGCHLYISIVICRLTFFAKCDILNFEGKGIPETVGGLNFLLLPLPLLNLQQLGGDRYDGSICHLW